MEVYVSIFDYESRYGPVPAEDSDRIAMLLEDACGILLNAYETRWGAYEEGAHPMFDRQAKAVACAIVSRAVNVPIGFEGATQVSQTAGDYSTSMTFANPTAELWLGKSDMRRLGLCGTRIGSIGAMTASDRERR